MYYLQHHCSRYCRRRGLWIHHRTEVTPTLIRLKVMRLSLVLRLEAPIQPLVSRHFIQTQLATTTQQSDYSHSFITRPVPTTLLPVLMHFCSTELATITRRSG